MKLPYFKIKEAFDEAKDSFSYGNGTEKISSAAKLFGKTVANVGMLAVEVGAEAIKKLPEETGKNVAAASIFKDDERSSKRKLRKPLQSAGRT